MLKAHSVPSGGILEQGNRLWNDLGFSGHALGQVSPACPFEYGLLARSQLCRGNGTAKEISDRH